jgi:hypothetical protein
MYLFKKKKKKREVVGVLKLMENERLQLVSQEVKNGVITSV